VVRCRSSEGLMAMRRRRIAEQLERRQAPIDPPVRHVDD
jgi:hypothetical protein